MPESLGARLRHQRERQDIALSTIAEQTKIKRSLLEELERDDVSHWPVGIFRRAFIRAYAHAIGLEPDVIVREFLERYPDPREVVAAASDLAAGPDGSGDSARPPTRFRYLVGRAFRSLSGHPNAATPAPETAPKASSPRPPSELDLLAAAQLCTELGRVDKLGGMPPLLQEAARILDAIGLIVWVWDPQASGLRPALTHGYSDEVLAHVSIVRSDAHNVTAEAFRSTRACTVSGSDHSSGALVVPLMTATGCVGVLAIELQGGGEQSGSVRALATILAAQLAKSSAIEPLTARVRSSRVSVRAEAAPRKEPRAARVSH